METAPDHPRDVLGHDRILAQVALVADTFLDYFSEFARFPAHDLAGVRQGAPASSVGCVELRSEIADFFAK